MNKKLSENRAKKGKNRAYSLIGVRNVVWKIGMNICRAEIEYGKTGRER